MSFDKTLGKIPIVVEGSLKPGRRLHYQRRAFQIGFIAVALLIPVSGLFRIDPVAGAFIVLDRQIWFSDFFLVFGLWMALASGLVMTYSAIGTAFCRWMCPQNTFSEWANLMTQKLLGKHAEVELDGNAMRVSSGKNKWTNWMLLGLLFLVASMLIALIPMFYFYPPSVIWSFVTFREDARLAGSLYWIYSMFVIMIFLDIAVIRHFWCRFMCIYKVWQHSFKTRQTLHIAYDPSFAEECAHCNFCVSACFVDIDPRNTQTYDACVNCGECITACANIRESRNSGGSLLRFELGERAIDRGNRLIGLSTLFRRVTWTTPLTALGVGMFVWGIISYQPYHFTAYRADTMHGDQILDYRISISNKLYHPGNVNVRIEGLPEGSYRLSAQRVTFSTAERRDLELHLSDSLPGGLYPFLVHVESEEGWHGSFRVHHFAGNKT